MKSQRCSRWAHGYDRGLQGAFPLELESERKCLGTGGGPEQGWGRNGDPGHGFTLGNIPGLWPKALRSQGVGLAVICKAGSYKTSEVQS